MQGFGDDLDRLLANAFSSPLWPWVVGSLVTYVLATDAFCVLRKKGRLRSAWASGLAYVGRFLVFLGIPYLVLGGWPRPSLSGLLTLRDLGLVGRDPGWPVTRWLEAVGDGLGLGLVALAVLLLAWANANRRSGQVGTGYGLRLPPEAWWSVALDVVAFEVHWAFYRGSLVLILDDLYAGVFAGLGLVYLEWILSALWWRNWQSRSLVGSMAAVQWLRMALALVSALVYLVTKNLWACLLVHGLIEWVFRLVSGPALKGHRC